MPLSPTKLIKDISAIVIMTNVDMPQLLSTTIQAAQWATVISDYMSLVGPLSPNIKPASLASKAVLYSSILGSMQTKTFHIMLPSILAVQAASIAVGFAPMYVATPPLTPCVLASVFLMAQNGGTSEMFAYELGIAIDLWMRTGTASLVTPTGPMPPVPWF